jgi:hypothetical protein
LPAKHFIKLGQYRDCITLLQTTLKLAQLPKVAGYFVT